MNSFLNQAGITGIVLAFVWVLYLIFSHAVKKGETQ